jgi:hypothetical protein
MNMSFNIASRFWFWNRFDRALIKTNGKAATSPSENLVKAGRQTASVPITAKGYQSMSDAQVGAAAMSGSPNAMFPKIPIPPAEVSLMMHRIVSLRNV